MSTSDISYPSSHQDKFALSSLHGKRLSGSPDYCWSFFQVIAVLDSTLGIVGYIVDSQFQWSIQHLEDLKRAKM